MTALSLKTFTQSDTGVDLTLDHLGAYLFEQLNLKSPQVVKGYTCFDDLPGDNGLYPLLVIHRLTSAGEDLQNCTAMLKYMMLSQSDRRSRPGLFRWLELAMVKCLREYEYREPPMILDLSSIRTRYRIGMTSNAVFPLLELTFSFTDLTTLANQP